MSCGPEADSSRQETDEHIADGLEAKDHTILFCVVIVLRAYSLHFQSHQVGRFQWLDTPGRQLRFDTATGQRCWVWSDVTEEDKLPQSDNSVLHRSGSKISLLAVCSI